MKVLTSTKCMIWSFFFNTINNGHYILHTTPKGSACTCTLPNMDFFSKFDQVLIYESSFTFWTLWYNQGRWPFNKGTFWHFSTWTNWKWLDKISLISIHGWVRHPHYADQYYGGYYLYTLCELLLYVIK